MPSEGTIQTRPRRERQLDMQPGPRNVAQTAGQAGPSADQALVERAGRGDHDAFHDLVESRLATAFRTAAAILGNEADAHDAVQEAFTSAWINLPRLREVGRFDAWLSRIVLNRCRDALRRRKRAQEVNLEDVILTHELEPDLDLTALNAAFERLDVDQRHLLALHHLHRESVADIAQELRRPVGTVKWRLHRARRALHRALEAER
jgi:RNA polymerase sigma-70 factor (ECF subfamily)